MTQLSHVPPSEDSAEPRRALPLPVHTPSYSTRKCYSYSLDHHTVLNRNSTDTQPPNCSGAHQLLRTTVKLQIQIELLMGKLSFYLLEAVFFALVVVGLLCPSDISACVAPGENSCTNTDPTGDGERGRAGHRFFLVDPKIEAGTRI